jgi:uncharacterized protein YutE (UPF0331/DUF86 family)
MFNGVILQKLQALDETLEELRSLGQVDAEQLEADWRTRRAVERDLQVLVEIVVDVCQWLISLKGQTPATTGGDAISRCIQLGILSDFDAYGQMVRFRNFIVHRYDRVDVEILSEMVNEHLGDFERFRMEVMRHVRD